MLYIICAFEAEARALIDHYKLTKTQTSPYPLFEGDEIRLLICNMGPQKAKATSQYLLASYPLNENDAFLNLGICAAQEHFKIGELLQVSTLQNESRTYPLETFPSTIKKVTCYSSSQVLDKPAPTDIAEMEALALYDVVSRHFAPLKISFLKVVSDHFKPFKPKKQFIIELIRNNIDAIDKHINQLTGAYHA